MPIHGEYRMLKLHGEIAETLGMSKDNIFILENGESIVLNKHKITRGINYPASPIYIDGKDIKGINEAVLKDREIMQDDGLIAVIVGISHKKGKIIVPPKVITRAFIGNDEKMDDRIKQIVNVELEKIITNHGSFADIKNVIKSKIAAYVFQKTERRPLIIPVVMDEK